MTGQEVYKSALALLDELEIDGTVSDDTDDAYEQRAIIMINTMQREIARFEGVEPNTITALSDTLKISDDSADRIMPYGLAANFALADQMMDMYSVYRNEYKTGLRTISATTENMIDDMNVMSGF